MKPQRIQLRRATWLLMAAAALPSTPLLAQTQPPVTDVVVPPVSVPPPASQPTVTPTQPTTSTRTTPPPAATRPTPITEAPAAAERRAATRTTRSTARAAPAARVETPARSAAPAATAAAAPAEAPATPAADTPAPAPAEAAAPAPLPVPAEPASDGPSIWMFVIGGGLLALLGFALFQMLRHRRQTDRYEEVYDEGLVAAPGRGPYVEPAPVAAEPAFAGGTAFAAHGVGNRQETVSTPSGDLIEPGEPVPAAEESVAVPEEAVVVNADPADAEVLAASSAAPDGRPWIEFLMRPVRAGTSKDAAVVEFELTVGNTGTAPARDVRISTFMFAAGSAQESEMERMLIDPPADATLANVEIEAGDATRVEASMALPREALADESVLPVVVADARYRLPDGSEGRTRASFEVGIPSEAGLDPFPTDRTSGLLESVEARLHGDPERV